VIERYGPPIRLVIGLVSLALLTSIGGAGIAAAPVTLPLLWWAGWTSRNAAARALLNVVAVLTAAEGAWAVAYLAFGDGSAATLWLPVVAAVVVFVAYPLTQSRVARPASLA
jgi:hypothetical protein